MLVMCDIKLILTSDLKGVGLVCCHASAVVIKVWQLILSVYTGCFSLSVQTNVMSLNYSFLLHSLEHHPKTKHSSLFYLAFCRPLKLISSPQENFHYCNDKTRTRRWGKKVDRRRKMCSGEERKWGGGVTRLWGEGDSTDECSSLMSNGLVTRCPWTQLQTLLLVVHQQQPEYSTLITEINTEDLMQCFTSTVLLYDTLII